jgi:GntR family transcriptional repressor for pyruvate dehydrogenase complex
MSRIGGRMLVPQSAVQRIQAMILEGPLAPGQRLPAQRELSEQLGISRASLREALSVLETLGLVRVEVGRGVFVVGAGGETAGRRHEPKWRFADRYSPLEVYETRLMLEPRAAALAAVQPDETALLEIARSVERMRRAVETGDLIAAADCDSVFHRAIVERSGNRMFVELFRTVDSVMDEIQRLPFIHQDRIGETVDEHEAIAAALNARDAAASAKAMARHIMAAAGRIGVTLAL